MMKRDLKSLVLAVLQLRDGESHVIRERHLDRGTFHKYRDGWHYFLDVPNRIGCPSTVIGWSFADPSDVVTFLQGRPGLNLANHALVGERL